MEKHLDSQRVFSWSHAYVDYRVVKAWIGTAYPFGEWHVSQAGDALAGDDDGTPQCIAGSGGVADIVASGPPSRSPPPPRWLDVSITCFTDEAQPPDAPGSCLGALSLFQPQSMMLRCIDPVDSHPQQPPSLPPSAIAAAVAPRPLTATVFYNIRHREMSSLDLAASFIGADASNLADIVVDEAHAATVVQCTEGSPNQLRKQRHAATMQGMMPLRSVLRYVHDITLKNRQFATMLLRECDKVEAFYSSQSQRWTRVLLRLLDRCHVLRAALTRLVEPAALGGRNATFRKKQRRVLRKQLRYAELAMQRVYFAFTLLGRFVAQNSDGVRHLVSKVESRSQQHLMLQSDAFLGYRYTFFVPTNEGVPMGLPIASLLELIEMEYIVLIGGDKKAAARELHVVEETDRANERLWDAVVVGALLGLSVACVGMALFENNLIEGSEIPVTVFSGIFATFPASLLALTGLVTLLAVLFSVNIVVWDVFGVHYAFIFQLDDRGHWDGVRLLRYCMRYAATWSVGLLAYLRVDEISVMAKYTPYIPYLILALFLVMLSLDMLLFRAASKFLFKRIPMIPGPLQWQRVRRRLKMGVSETSGADSEHDDPSASLYALHRRNAAANGVSQPSTSSWLRRTLWRIISAPWYPVAFSDFYLADQLTSLTGPFGQVQVMLTTIVLGAPLSVPVVACLPHVWRLLQCFRRWRDQMALLPAGTLFSTPLTRDFVWSVVHPNLTNAGKYTAGLLQILAAWRFDRAYRHATASFTDGDGTTTTIIDWDVLSLPLACWVVAAAVEYAFKTTWDLYMDAGLLHTGRNRASPWSSFLRTELLYPLPTYWAYMVLDVVLRTATMFRILLIYVASSWSHINPVVWWCLEVGRRFVWNFFRVECEQISNMEKYRAVDVVPPVWSTAERAVLGGGDADAHEDPLAALWSSQTASEHALPSKRDLFHRLPLSHQRSAYYAFVKGRSSSYRQRRSGERSGGPAASVSPQLPQMEAVWDASAQEIMSWFNTLNHEDQLKVIFLAVGQTPLETFLQHHNRLVVPAGGGITVGIDGQPKGCGGAAGPIEEGGEEEDDKAASTSSTRSVSAAAVEVASPSMACADEAIPRADV